MPSLVEISGVADRPRGGFEVDFTFEVLGVSPDGHFRTSSSNLPLAGYIGSRGTSKARRPTTCGVTTAVREYARKTLARHRAPSSSVD